jgi:hypothetical protein
MRIFMRLFLATRHKKQQRHSLLSSSSSEQPVCYQLPAERHIQRLIVIKETQERRKRDARETQERLKLF